MHSKTKVLYDHNALMNNADYTVKPKLTNTRSSGDMRNNKSLEKVPFHLLAREVPGGRVVPCDPEMWKNTEKKLIFFSFTLTKSLEPMQPPEL